jgi:hypothetical protein
MQAYRHRLTTASSTLGTGVEANQSFMVCVKPVKKGPAMIMVDSSWAICVGSYHV